VILDTVHRIRFKGGELSKEDEEYNARGHKFLQNNATTARLRVDC
jgi:hypothetical protein